MDLGLDAKSTFKAENVKINKQSVKLYTALYIYKNEHLDKNGLSYTQIKSWITNDGWVLREEIIVGVIDPKKIRLRRTYDFEYYAKNLTIVPPILKVKAKF